MNWERAEELHQSQTIFRMRFDGLVQGYKLAQIIGTHLSTLLVDVVYPNSPWGSGGFKCTRFPLEMMDEFEGPWNPRDLKFLEDYGSNGTKSKRTKGYQKKSRRTK